MIIGINGKKQSGKDTIGKIIKYLSTKELHDVKIEHYLTNCNICNTLQTKWQIIKFADKLKDIVCIILGCTREQLEDDVFKNRPLGKEWNIGLLTYTDKYDQYGMWFNNKKEAIAHLDQQNCVYWSNFEMIVLTPRMLLQQLGTDVCRNIHPNLWINATMRDYKPINSYNELRSIEEGKEISLTYPNWIVTDVRFPNEYDAIKERNGIIIRVNRINSTSQDGHSYVNKRDRTHPSETALDNHKFDYTIDNNGTIEELIDKVKDILIKENLI